MYERAEKDRASDGNPTSKVRHMTRHGSGECLGLHVWLWCPGCQAAHTPTFRCPDHGGPAEGPTWDGDPHSEPFTMEPSYLSDGNRPERRCHSYVRGHWQFLGDCAHALRGQTVPLEPLPDWLV